MFRYAQGQRALVVGCHGGVASAVQGVIEKSQTGQELLASLDSIFLVDERPAHPDAAPLTSPKAQLLPPTRIASANDLGRLIEAHGITQVIDLSSMDTVDCTRVCDELGVDFLATSVEEWASDNSLSTDENIGRLLPPKRPALENRSHLVGSGANPGIVNALVFAAIDKFAELSGAEPSAKGLDLHSILVTEVDTTTERATEPRPGVFSMTWSPEQCLDEIFEPRSFAARNDAIVDLGHPPTAALYRARCGDRMIEGMAIPHEETKTLAWRLPNVEFAFIYQLPDAAMRSLAMFPERTDTSHWETRRLYPPGAIDLEGHDRVGVLLCSRLHGELWLGFDTPVARGLDFGTNATQLQVAAGVLAGWVQLGSRRGIHFVEDLDCRQFLEVASEILGSPVAAYDREAPTLELSERMIAPLLPT